MYQRVGDVPWHAWRGEQRATLCFVVCGRQILLIHKKRGIGAGKINGPGGRIEAGETPEACAVREVKEEVGVKPTGLVDCGELRFQFTDGLSIHCYVFRASGCHGEPVETDEAVPFWNSLDAIPYERMWVDDVLWIPHMLAGRRFDGRFLFDGDRMLDHALRLRGQRRARL